MKTITTLGIALVSLLLVVSCKKEASINIDQSRIYSDYHITYDQPSNRTTAQALFRVDNSNGQKIELSYPSRVRFDGENMAWRKVVGVYEVHQTGNALHGAFEYFDLEENEFAHAHVALNAIDIPYGLNTVSRNGHFFLPWTGAPLESGETVRVEISGGNQSTSRTFNTSSLGANYIVLHQNELNDLSAGTAQIQIMREKRSGIQNATLAGGKITSTYQGRKVSIHIVE